jgi:4'-phosphopantetheinyl transferase EntD
VTAVPAMLEKGLLDPLLPSAARGAEYFGDPDGAVLFPEEEAVISTAVEKRRREFTSVRHCARRALAALGFPACPLLPGPYGAPRWPACVVGSMTHCQGYRAAVVALESELAALGIDAERHAPLPEGVLEAVAGAEELRHLAGLADNRPGMHWDRLLFSAKEAAYKAWSPAAGRRIAVQDVSVRFVHRTDAFSARVLPRSGPAVGPDGGRVPDSFEGRWLVRAGVAVTLAVHPA